MGGGPLRDWSASCSESDGGVCLERLLGRDRGKGSVDSEYGAILPQCDRSERPAHHGDSSRRPSVPGFPANHSFGQGAASRAAGRGKPPFLPLHESLVRDGIPEHRRLPLLSAARVRPEERSRPSGPESPSAPPQPAPGGRSAILRRRRGGDVALDRRLPPATGSPLKAPRYCATVIAGRGLPPSPPPPRVALSGMGGDRVGPGDRGGGGSGRCIGVHLLPERHYGGRRMRRSTPVSGRLKATMVDGSSVRSAPPPRPVEKQAAYRLSPDPPAAGPLSPRRDDSRYVS